MQKQPSEGFFRKDFMKNFPEITKKHLSRNLFFDKVKLCTPATSLKTRLQKRCFIVKFAEFAGTPFLQNTTGQLLLIAAVSIVRVQVKEQVSEVVVRRLQIRCS